MSNKSSLKRPSSELSSSCSISYGCGNAMTGRFKSIERSLSNNSISSNSNSSRSSPLLLDCHSLQSSLKRVRLSCSPGELRLQRDLRSLVMEQGWNQVEEHCWSLEGVATLEQVTQYDPLRLLLTICCNPVHDGMDAAMGGRSSEVEASRMSWRRCWITIPRMYPHRPPVISRIEDVPSDNGTPSVTAPSDISWSGHSGFNQLRKQQKKQRPPPVVERIVIHETPPNGQTPLPVPCATTVVFDHWSPIMRLGDLLSFAITTLMDRTPLKSGDENTHPPNNHWTHSSPSSTVPVPTTIFNGFPKSNQTQTRTASFSSSSSSPSTSPSPTNAIFVEEQKMGDSSPFFSRIDNAEYPNQRFNTRGGQSDFCNFPPNRFDAGYGKYLDPLQRQQQQQTIQTLNAMDVS